MITELREFRAPSPTYKSMEREKDKLVISFNNLSEPYKFNDANSIVGFSEKGTMRFQGFEIAGEDGVFYPATAHLKWWENKSWLVQIRSQSQ